MRFRLLFCMLASLFVVCSRQVIAGDITAIVQPEINGRVLVTGSEGDDSLTVTVQSGQLVLTAGRNTTINGKRRVKFPEALLRIENMGAGADSLTLENLTQLDSINMGDGADTLTVKRYRLGTLSAFMGAGDDTIKVTDVVSPFVFFVMGSGNDITSVSNVVCEFPEGDNRSPSFRWEGGEGNDLLFVDDLSTNSFEVFGGGGNDVTLLSEVIQPRLPIPPENQEPRFVYDAGINDVSDWDYLHIQESSLTNASIFGSSGDDYMYVDDTTFDSNWGVFMGFDGDDTWISTRCHFLYPANFVNGWTGQDRFVSIRDVFDTGRPTPVQFEYVLFK